MKEEIHTWLTQLYAEKTSRAEEVGEVFNDYFGEPLVDVQKPDIENFIDNYSSFRVRQAYPRLSRNEEEVTIENTLTIPRAEWNALAEKTCFDNLEGEFFNLAKPELERRLDSWFDSNPTFIIVRFPKVTVTNENDRSIDITELYARVGICTTGRILWDLSFFRAEYTAEQWRSGYAHSHLPSTAQEWQSPCLGSGPIRNTQNYLRDHFDLDRWGLFCYELSKYVTVESLDGVPYIRLESVGMYGGQNVDFPYFRDSSLGSYDPMLKRFAAYYLRTKNFKVSFVNGIYNLGCDPVDFLVEVTKYFIEWYNKRAALGNSRFRISLSDLKDKGVLCDYVISDRTLRWPRRAHSDTNMQSLQGRELFMFKGNMVTLNFTGLEEEANSSSVTLLNHDYVASLITHILKIFNYEYGHKENTESTNSQNTSHKKHRIF